jgi:hypothetical protein
MRSLYAKYKEPESVSPNQEIYDEDGWTLQTK